MKIRRVSRDVAGGRGSCQTPLSYTAQGEIDERAAGATYRIPLLSAQVLQRTAITETGLLLTQETPWMRAQVLLQRR